MRRATAHRDSLSLPFLSLRQGEEKIPRSPYITKREAKDRNLDIKRALKVSTYVDSTKILLACEFVLRIKNCCEHPFPQTSAQILKCIRLLQYLMWRQNGYCEKVLIHCWFLSQAGDPVVNSREASVQGPPPQSSQYLIPLSKPFQATKFHLYNCCPSKSAFDRVIEKRNGH